MIEGYLTTREAAEKLGVSEGRVRQFVAEGRLEAVKVGHTNLIKEAHLERVALRPTGRPLKSKATESAQ